MINHSPVLHGSNEVTHISLFTPIRLFRLVRERIVSMYGFVFLYFPRKSLISEMSS